MFERVKILKKAVVTVLVAKTAGFMSASSFLCQSMCDGSEYKLVINLKKSRFQLTW